MSGPIATYTFLPWLRQGLASKIQQNETLGEEGAPVDRASVRVALQVNGEPEFVSTGVQLVGPGDILGINPRAVVRTEPRHWVTDFEPNYLAFIEFYDEEFLWRYTPARAVQVDQAGNSVSDSKQTKLRPWIFLIALEEDEFEISSSGSGPLPVLRLKPSAEPEAIFPPADQVWAWGHVHVSKDVTGAGTHTTPQMLQSFESVVRQNPDEALCRLVCPRKLRPRTGYHALVIPTFEAGRVAGLGQPTAGLDALAPSWGAGQLEYPVYYQWYFHTGERGDFRFLVNLLKPRPADERVGVRHMDMQQPDFEVPGMRDGPGDEPVMGLEGALKSPQAVPRPAAWPPADAAQHPAFLTELAHKVNLQDVLLEPAESAAGHPDPIVSPPLYGRWHALQKRLEVTLPGWVNELNRDPRNRVPAGFGTQVVQAHQETYMQQAWQQLGDVLKANQKIRQLQLALVVSQRIHWRHLRPLRPDQQLAVTRPVHGRVMGSPTTVLQQVAASRLPQAALTSAFRRITRPQGAVARKTLRSDVGKPADLLTPLNEGSIAAAPPKRAPDQHVSLDMIARALVSDRVPAWLRDLVRHPLWRWGLGALIVLSLTLIAAFGAVALLGAVLAAGVLIATEPLRRRLQAADRLRDDAFTAGAIEAVAPRPAFALTEPGEDVPADIARSGNTDSPEAANLRTALNDLHERLEIELPQPSAREALDMTGTARTLVRALDPVVVIPKRARGLVSIPPGFARVRPVDTIVPVMAHPVFSDPMYKRLRDISTELLIPNLDLIPNNTITVLQTNPKFIEAYMVGLNHEMARELLWRRYDTDQRGSYFRQFWDVSEIVNRDPSKDPKQLEEELRDIAPLHRWRRDSGLGTHENRSLPAGTEPDAPRLVLAIRGDVLKRYPTAVVYAQKARWIDDPESSPLSPRKIRVLDERNAAANLMEPIFKADIEPDLRFLGFDLTAVEAKGDATPPSGSDGGNPGWFFVIAQRPGEPRFSLNIEEVTPPTPTAWNELAWNHLGEPGTIQFIDVAAAPATSIPDGSADKSIHWGVNAADMAYILYDAPVMVAVHAGDTLQ